MTHPADHEPDWSNPVDELGGRRACRVCGRVADQKENGQAFFVERAALRERAKKLARRRRRK